MPAPVVKYQNRVLWLLAVLSIITYLDRVCISVAGPRMQDDLQISPEAWGWVTGVFAISYGAFSIPIGALGDRFGPRRVLTWIVLWWSAFTTLTGPVSNYYLLLLMRFCFGAGEAGAYPNASAAILRWIPASRVGHAWGIVWMASQIGGAISPLVVVPIQAQYGWRASFYLFGILGVIWSVVWYRWFRDSPGEKPGATMIEPAEIGATPPQKGQPLPWSTALRSGNLRCAMGIAACYVYGMYFFHSWFQTYLLRGRGFSEGELMLSAWPYVVGACANAVGGVTSDRLARTYGLKTGRRIVGVAGLGAAALFMTATVLTESGRLALIFLSLAYGGMTFQQPNLFAVALGMGRKHPGMVLGFVNTAAQAASLISSVAFGYIVKGYGSYDAPLIPMAVALFAGVLLWFRVDPTLDIFEEKSRILSGPDRR
jgi:MFS transporter, ACS family, glucarate transporter